MTDDDIRAVADAVWADINMLPPPLVGSIMADCARARPESNAGRVLALCDAALRARQTAAALEQELAGGAGGGVCDTCGGEVTGLVWPSLPPIDGTILLDCGNALLLPCGHADGYTPAGEDVA